jgi:dipeptidyl aminopeptidase/acylaminoacyl peptidase
MKALAVWWLLVAGTGLLDAQAILSRRDYAERGRTFTQIWMADAGSLNFRQLTHSARDHSEPVCSRDGRLIYFLSDPDPERSRNSYAGADDREVWAYDRQAGQERIVWRWSIPGDFHLALAGTAASGGVLVRAGAELRSLAQNSWSRLWTIASADEVAISPDGRRLALVIAESYDKQGNSQNARLFVADAATGQSRREIGKYETPTWSPDGTRIAAFFDGGLAILDATTGREIERVGLPKPDRPPQDIVWSLDGKTLLAGLYGEDGGAGDPQSDYFLLNLATPTWTPSLTARQLLWLPDGAILNLLPFQTTPLEPASPHSVWTSQLAIYNPASHKNTALTSGLVLNDQFSTCGH